MNKDYYVEYYSLEREHWWFVVRAKIIRERIQPYLPSGPLKILNIGAATGSTTELLGALGNVVSIEYDQDCCEFARNKTGLDIRHGSILDLDFPDDSFDLVCAFDVIEHVEDDQKAMDEMRRVCRADGIIYVTVPAYNFLWSEHDVVNHHFRRYTMGGLEQLFHEDLQILYKTYFNSLLFPPIAAFRVISKLLPSKWYRKGAGADNTLVENESFVNRILFKIFDLERKILTRTKFPFGVSIMAILKKKS